MKLNINVLQISKVLVPFARNPHPRSIVLRDESNLHINMMTKFLFFNNCRKPINIYENLSTTLFNSGEIMLCILKTATGFVLLMGAYAQSDDII